MREPADDDAAARAAFLRACRLDVDTPKPGNVSAARPGHGMTAALFVASATAAEPALFARGAPVGPRILDAIARTRDVAGCNTNLGIVLLAAPLAAALDGWRTQTRRDTRRPTIAAWRDATERVLARLDVDDARAAYRAIALASPGGLGDAPEQPVQQPPSVNLRAAMTLAAQRDSIARQYANGFADVFGFGLAAARESAPSGLAPTTLHIFLTFAAAWPDSHIVRKHGTALAQSVTHTARELHARWRASLARGDAGAIRAALAALDAWDVQLKTRRVNPGTSADLTVATLFVALYAADGPLRHALAEAR